MPFGLKNAGATYQRAMTTIFQDMMHKEIEAIYIDDIVVKSGKGGVQYWIGRVEGLNLPCRANALYFFKTFNPRNKREN